MSQSQPTQQSGAEPPLEWPWYGIGFSAAIKRFFKKYATFTGRASRGEFWWFALFNLVIGVIYSALLGLLGGFSASMSGQQPPAGAYAVQAVFGLYSLATIIPSLALAIRRLHDTGRSGWFILLGLIPFVGGIILLVFYAGQTTPSAEQYGPPSSQSGFGASGQQTYPPNQGYPTS